jgi:hypothetical protein
MILARLLGKLGLFGHLALKNCTQHVNTEKVRRTKKVEVLDGLHRIEIPVRLTHTHTKKTSVSATRSLRSFSNLRNRILHS